jgi:hypothetical protein
MNTTLTAIPGVPGRGGVMGPLRADARLAPGGRRERDTQVDLCPRAGQSPLADQAARWQHILDLLDPSKRCGAWSPTTFEGHPVVCTLAPHDSSEEHANAETGWRWYDEGC